jgi:hypothetical protein
MQMQFIAVSEDEAGNEIGRSPRGFARRHAEVEKVFGVHLK